MNAVVRQDNPFGSSAIAEKQAEALVAVEQTRAIAETQAAMAIAKRFPRDPRKAVDNILTACARNTLAEQALYVYSRGGTEITGPSIRLAEALAQQWGNLQFGIRELEQRNGESTVETFAWDIETNVRQTKIFQVKHMRDTKKGSYALTDQRDIYELTANQGARRLRACILGVIPGDVVEAAVKQCEATMATKAEVTPEKIQKLLELFAEYGVTKEQIEKRIQRHIDAMAPAQMLQLRKIGNSIADGMSTPADWFEILAPAEGAPPSTGAAKLKEAAARAKNGTKPPETPQTPLEQAGADVTLAVVLGYISKATSVEQADLAIDSGRGVLSDEDMAKATKARDDKFPPPKE
jgi:hypothetical protein